MPNDREMIVKIDLVMVGELRKVLKRLHYPLEVMLVCSPLECRIPAQPSPSERNDCQERGVFVDRSAVHRWALKILLILALIFRRRRQPLVTSWRMDETYIKVTGQWKYLYRAARKADDTVDFLLSAKRDLAAARRYLERAIDLHGLPEKITIDKSGANTAGIRSVNQDDCLDIELR